MNEIFVVFDYTLSIENIEKLYFTLVEIVCIVFFFFFFSRKSKHFVPEDFFLINMKRLIIKRKKIFLSLSTMVISNQKEFLFPLIPDQIHSSSSIMVILKKEFFYL